MLCPVGRVEDIQRFLNSVEDHASAGLVDDCQNEVDFMRRAILSGGSSTALMTACNRSLHRAEALVDRIREVLV
jgi:hypothetical protein